MRNDNDWIPTYTGKQFWPLDPDPAAIDLEDIAHHLSLICRFTGAVRRHYSVAEHSLYVMEATASIAGSMDDTLLLQALLHDAAEAYLNDVVSPIKASLVAYRQYETHLQKLVYRAFDLPEEMPEVVHQADNAVLAAERIALLRPGGPPWKRLDGVEPARVQISRDVPGWQIEVMFRHAAMSLLGGESGTCQVCGATDNDFSGRHGSWADAGRTICAACGGKEMGS
jgi:hypothetical protein